MNSAAVGFTPVADEAETDRAVRPRPIMKGIDTMKRRLLLLLLALTCVNGVGIALSGCAEEEPPPMENAPDDPSYAAPPGDG